MPQASRLFAFTSWVVRIATVLCVALGVLLILAIGGVLAAAMGLFAIPLPASVTGGLPIPVVLLAAAMVIVACDVVVALVAMILVLVGRIVDSARAGDPFVVKNAERLNGVGLLMLAIQGIGMITGMAVEALPKAAHAHLNMDFGLSFTGLLSALLVFVLAQIFRHGSEMRAELEGTV